MECTDNPTGEPLLSLSIPCLNSVLSTTSASKSYNNHFHNSLLVYNSCIKYRHNYEQATCFQHDEKEGCSPEASLVAKF